MISEIEQIKNELRAEVILLQAHVEYMVDEILEVLIESNALRGNGTQLKKKLKILKHLGWIKESFENDIIKLSAIRGIVAHRIDVYDEKTRIQIRDEFKQITLLQNTKKICKQDESNQTSIRKIAEIYFLVLCWIYEKVYQAKSQNSIQNPNSVDDYSFEMQGNEINIINDTI